MSSAVQPLSVEGATIPASPWPASLRMCLPPAIAAAAWHILLLAVYLLPYGGDVSALVCVDRQQLGGWPYEAIHVGFPTGGFDGQFYYTLARDPWRCHDKPLDLPVYRHARILYPALAWLLSGGGSAVRLLWVLPAINVLAAAWLAWIGARLAMHHGRPAWWGFLLPAVINVAMPAMRELTDPLAALTVCGLLAAWLLRRPTWVVFAWGTAAVLSREQNAAAVIIVLMAAGYHRQWRHAVGLGAALLLMSGWFVALHVAYGAWPYSSDNLSRPLTGIIERFYEPRGFYSWREVATQIAGRVTVVLQIAACVALAFCRVSRTVKLTALAGAALAVLAGPAVYGDEWSYLRVFTWMPLALWVGSVMRGVRWPLWALSPMVAWPCWIGVQAVRLWVKKHHV
jgi:hypothetical protein